MEHVAKSAPDGHTLGMVVTPLVILPALRDKMPYDTLKDLAPVTLTGVSSILIAASPTPPAPVRADRTGEEAAGKLTASPGLAADAPRRRAAQDGGGHRPAARPFKGGAQAYPELMAGRIDLQLDPTFGIYRHVKGGKMKAIAVTSARRDPAAPEVPTVGETLPGQRPQHQRHRRRRRHAASWCAGSAATSAESRCASRTPPGASRSSASSRWATRPRSSAPSSRARSSAGREWPRPPT